MATDNEELVEMMQNFNKKLANVEELKVSIENMKRMVATYREIITSKI